VIGSRIFPKRGPAAWRRRSGTARARLWNPSLRRSSGGLVHADGFYFRRATTAAGLATATAPAPATATTKVTKRARRHPLRGSCQSCGPWRLVLVSTCSHIISSFSP
jgi:hypothetical protein